MTQTLWSLLILACWSVLLGASIISWRTWLVFTTRTKSNEFPSGSEHGSDLYWRLNRAQINSIENASTLFIQAA